MARRFRGSHGARRATSWLDLPPVFSGISGTGTLLLSLTVPEKAKRPFTIVRTHLRVHIQSDQSLASEIAIAAVGMCVVSDQASAIGITALPTPLTDLASDLWFVHQLIFNNFVFADATGFVESAGEQVEVDSKAMRKVNDDEDVVVVAEIDTALANGASMILAGRVLIKEH